MEELRRLADAAGYEVLGSLEQVRRHPHPRYNIGSGKARELAEMISVSGAEKVIFGNELKVVQVYNLARLTGVEVIDRFQLILEIFVRRASRREAKLQIELARLQYELAHAREKVRLARISEQPGFLGLGKYEVDVYREAVRRQVHSIQGKLKRVRKTRGMHRHRRRKLGFPSASLAGYTNSGKSTLFNTLTQESVPADSSMFTTLSTTTRAVNLLGDTALLTDTVGFVDRLPLTLIEAFRSTLEETIFSDLILLVVDLSEPEDEIERKLLCSLETIQEIGATGIPVITVLNKIDLIPTETLTERMQNLKDHTPNPVPVSALYKTNTNLLREEMARRLISRVQSSFTVPISSESLSLVSWVFDHADVHRVAYEKDQLSLSFGAPPRLTDKIRNRVERLGGTLGYEEVESLRTQAKP
ncbi:MAG: GTPase HflX [Candidatus Bathyarchaeota archaeon]|nr:GTPase HflX [Candidatus Bathyarchaeota archaeon]